MASTKTCAFWLNGQCTFGAQCRNLHGSQDHAPSSPIVSSTTTSCPHFLRGSCKFGDQCRFPHISPVGSSTRAVPPKPPTPLTPSSGLTTTPICAHFLSGNCRFGTQCRFSHVASIKAPNAENLMPASPLKTPALGACKFFQAGQCLRDNCSFPHIPASPTQARAFSGWSIRSTPSTLPTKEVEKTNPRPVPLGMETTLVSDAPPNGPALSSLVPEKKDPDQETGDERSMLSCKVVFGPGMTIESITTAFESSVILVTDIPRNASEETLLVLLETFGDLKSFMREEGKSSARAEFVSPRHAAAAIEGLTDHQLGSSTLSAQYEVGAVQTGSAIFRSTKVKLSFFAPAVIVYAHYGTITKARNEAARLDAMVFDGNTIRAAFQQPTFKQTESFSVVIKGLSPKITDAPSVHTRLKAFTHAVRITIGKPTYTMSERTISAVRKLLESFGRLESFDMAANYTSKVVAWAQFASSDGALQAHERLHGRPQRVVGNSPVWVEQVHALRYTLPKPQFSALKDELDRYAATLDVASRLRYYEFDQDGITTDPVVLRLYSADAKALAQAKGRLDALMQGEKLVDGTNTVVWDDVFATEEGRSFLEHVCRHTHAYVECQARMRTLRLHGPLDTRMSACEMLLAKREEIDRRRHIIVLERDTLRGLLSGGFRLMQKELGDRALRLDVVHRTITVRGDDMDVAAVRRRLASLGTGAPLTHDAPARAGDCPVCFYEVSQHGIKLPCGHIYDTDCLRHLTQASLTGDFRPLTCVAETGLPNDQKACSSAIPLSQIRELLGPDEEARLFDVSLRAHVNARPDEFHYCPTPDCPVIYRPARAGMVLRCPSCLLRVCAHCHVEHHEGLSCEEHKDSLRPHAELFARWKAENGVKSCPKCRADIQKHGGCNHIHCAACKSHICWVCMKTFDEEDTRDGVYGHMQRIHGSMYG